MRVILVAATLLACVGSAHGQGIDCSKARTPVERAICGSPQLIALDRQIGAAYADAVAHRPEQAAELRGSQLGWLRARDARCTGSGAALQACLSEQMQARLAQLAPPPARTAPTAEARPVPTTPPPITPPPITPPPVTPPIVPPPAPRREVSVPTAANPPPPAATVSPAAFAAAERTDALLRVTSPGRFTLAAQSTTGVALQPVDMLTGPGDVAGEAGVRDGRIDGLLDVGVYRVRAFAAKGGTGEVRLTITAFHDAAPPRALPQPGETVSAELRDGEQRAFWMLVPPSGAVEIEAAGRALADLRLWRAGRELAALTPAARVIEPAAGQTLRDLTLSGKVEPGVYLAVAYGGPALPRADGGATAPFHLRAGLRDDLAEGWAGGAIGPFGSERFAAPAFAGLFRLRLEQPAPAELRVDAQTAAITQTSREPVASLRAEPGRSAAVEVRGGAGQSYLLRASEPAGSTRLSRAGTYWVSAVALGAGGDEVPPTVLLERLEARAPARIVAGNLARVGPSAGWRARFNLRGPTALLFEHPEGGAVDLRTAGVSVAGDAAGFGQYDLPADYYVLRLRPAPGAQGAIEAALGPAERSPPAAPPLPPDPVIPLGVQTIAPGQSLLLHAHTAPGTETGLAARPIPVALAEGPLALTEAPRSGPVTVPVTVAAGGTISARETGGGAVPITVEPAPDGGRRVTVPGTDRPRTVVLAWRRDPVPPADIPAPPPPASVPTVRSGQDLPFDLAAAGEQRGFALDVADGGLYRIETLGRLRTAGQIATPFIPELDTAEANGVGQNFLLQRWLRAGRYRVDVAAKDSFGHTALRAAPAPLLTGATLRPGGTVRATMPAGTGAAFGIEIAEQGNYHLDLASLEEPFTARLEDAEGWPITRPGPMTELDTPLQPGRYRLVVSPPAVTRRVLARLHAVRSEPVIEGHGPHPLPFAAKRAAVWREPPGRNDPRTPDAWTFQLAGPAEVTLSITDGMLGELWGDRAADRPLARITKTWSGRLEAGAYRLDAASLGRNDRLDYTVELRSRELQPGEQRSVTLPATVPFAVAQRRVVTVTSWGTLPVRAILRRDGGGEVLRIGPREDDWNIALSRPLEPGSYRLDVSSAQPGSGTTATPQDSGAAGARDEEASSDEDADRSDRDDQDAQSKPERDRSEVGDSGSTSASGDVEIRLALPETLPSENGAGGDLTGEAVHVLPIADAAPGRLLLARASSEGAVGLTLERQSGGVWSVVAAAEGRTPLVAAPADAEASAWRAEVWPIDRAPAPIRLAVRAAEASAQSPGRVALRAVDGLGVAAARVALPGPGVLTVAGAGWAGGWPGHAVTPVEGGQAVAEADSLWLLSDRPGSAEVAPLLLEPGAERVVTVPAGGTLTLPGAAAPAGSERYWLASSGLGQPGAIGDATPSGVAAGSMLAPAAAIRLRNASGDHALPIRLRLLDLAVAPAADPGPVTVPAQTAVPIRTGAGRYELTLPAGAAAVTRAAVAWAGDAPLTRTVQPGGTMTVLNTTGAAFAVSVRRASDDLPDTFRPGDVFKRFFGAAGSFDWAIAGAAGAEMAVAGNAELLWAGADGRVRRGRVVAADGPGRVIVTHGEGAVVLSVAGSGASPWPEPAPTPVTLPFAGALAGPAMAFSVEPGTASEPGTETLLHVSTTAPVLLGVGGGPPELFASGAELGRVVPAGATVLRVYPPQDGPLTGTLALSAEPIRRASEGLGDTIAVAPGGGAAFGFRLARAATIGLGVRAEPDRAQVRLLDRGGAVLGEGVAQLRTLPAGRYVLEVRVPPDAAPTLIRPALVGITPLGNGPPPDIVQHYLELVGLRPGDPAR